MMSRAHRWLVVLTLMSGGCTFSFDESAHCFAGQDCAKDGVTPDTPDEGDTGDDTAGDTDTGDTTDTATDTGSTDDVDNTTDDADTVDTGDLPDDDLDDDGLKNDDDNCPDVWNPTQLNYDRVKEPTAKRLGDACDPCPFDAVEPGADGACYSDFKAAQFDGDWIGYRIVHREQNTLAEIEAVGVNFNGGQYRHLSEGPGKYRGTDLFDGGLLHLPKFHEENGDVFGAMMVMDPNREVLVGHAFLSVGGSPVTELFQGRMLPPNLIILVRKRDYGTLGETDVLPELRGAPDAGAARRYSLHGWRQEADVAVQGLQGQFDAVQADDEATATLSLEAHNAGEKTGSVYAYTTHATAGLTSLGGLETPHLTFAEGGSLAETPGGVSLTMQVHETGAQEVTELALTGVMSFSRDIGVAVVSTDEQRILTLIGVEHLEPTPQGGATDPRLGQYALLGLHDKGALRGLIPTTPQSGQEIALQFHEFDGKGVAAGQKPIGPVDPAPAAIALDHTALYTVGGDFLNDPRVCIRVTPSRNLGLVLMCPHVNSSVYEGCKLETGCWLQLGVAIRISDQQPVGATDYDLDGKTAGEIPDLTPCQAESDDTCTCTINPVTGC